MLFYEIAGGARVLFSFRRFCMLLLFSNLVIVNYDLITVTRAGVYIQWS